MTKVLWTRRDIKVSLSIADILRSSVDDKGMSVTTLSSQTADSSITKRKEGGGGIHNQAQLQNENRHRDAPLKSTVPHRQRDAICLWKHAVNIQQKRSAPFMFSLWLHSNKSFFHIKELA